LTQTKPAVSPVPAPAAAPAAPKPVGEAPEGSERKKHKSHKKDKSHRRTSPTRRRRRKQQLLLSRDVLQCMMHKDCTGDQLGMSGILFVECMGAWSRAFCHAWGLLGMYSAELQQCSVNLLASMMYSSLQSVMYSRQFWFMIS